jgi:hypothetical protein
VKDQPNILAGHKPIKDCQHHMSWSCGEQCAYGPPQPELRPGRTLMMPAETRIEAVRPPLGMAMNFVLIADAVRAALPAEWSTAAREDAIGQIRDTLLGEGAVLIDQRSRADARAAKDPVLLALAASIEATQRAVETRLEEVCRELDRDEVKWADQHRPPAAMRGPLTYPIGSPEPAGVSTVTWVPGPDEAPKVFEREPNASDMDLWIDVADMGGQRYTWEQLNHEGSTAPFGPHMLHAVSFLPEEA